MGAICGSTTDTIKPINILIKPSNKNSKLVRRHNDKKPTSLEDIIKVKQRRNSDDAIMKALLKRKIY
jgi:hypothetical protein